MGNACLKASAAEFHPTLSGTRLRENLRASRLTGECLSSVGQAPIKALPSSRGYKTHGKEKQPPSGRKRLEGKSSARRAAALSCRVFYTPGFPHQAQGVPPERDGLPPTAASTRIKPPTRSGRHRARAKTIWQPIEFPAGSSIPRGSAGLGEQPKPDMFGTKTGTVRDHPAGVSSTGRVSTVSVWRRMGSERMSRDCTPPVRTHGQDGADVSRPGTIAVCPPKSARAAARSTRI